MTAMTKCKIIGFGHRLPAIAVSSAELEAELDLPSGWIVKRTGIESRRYTAAGEATSDLAIGAAQDALQSVDIDPRTIGLVLLATSTPDHLLPPTAPKIAEALGCRSAGAMDLAGACTGFLQSFILAASYVAINDVPAIVVGANTLSRRVNPDDVSTRVLFGDAAGAVVLAPANGSPSGILSHSLTSTGTSYDLIKVPAGGSRQPIAADTNIEETRISINNPRQAYANAIEGLIETSEAALSSAGLVSAALDWWIPHQANLRLLEVVRKRLGIPSEKMLTTVGEYANSSAATIPLTLSVHRQKLQAGQRIMMSAVGAGFGQGAAVFRL